MTTIQNYEDFVELTRNLHQPELAKRPGHVYQIWEDGEITSQKGGDLLWERTLHSLVSGIFGLSLPMPVQFHSHSFAFVSATSAVRIARSIVNLCRCDDSIKSIIKAQPSYVDYYEARIEAEARIWGVGRGAA